MISASNYHYLLISSPFGDFGLVWRDELTGARVQETILPRADRSMSDLLAERYANFTSGSCPEIDSIADALTRYFKGEIITLLLDRVALERCSEFQRRVLLAEYAIPRGWISTYGLVAAHLGAPRGARAVGGALAHNPFPILIPCHRALRSDLGLGGYQGGLAMKRALLEMEGVAIGPDGRAVTSNIYYRQ